MSLHRIKKLQRSIDMNESLFPEMPDFDNWNEDQLNQYIVSYINKFHIENNINCFEDAEKIYKDYLSREFISKEEFDLFIKGERKFWDKASRSDNEVFFLE